jgi:predicted AlkP superfamily phosphohydrolase/phosphomutase
MSKIILLGISGFDRGLAQTWLGDLPNLKRMQGEGTWGKIGGTVPSDCAASWTSVFSGTREKRVSSLYNILPNLGQKVAILGIPLTYPPPRIPGGYSVASPVKPGFTWPKSLEGEIHGLVGGLVPDEDTAGSLPSGDKGGALERIRASDAKSFTLVKYFMGKKRCDCVLAVLEGAGEAASMSLEHRDQGLSPVPESGMLRDYYRWLDGQIGEVREALDPSTVLMIVSEGGSREAEGNEGFFCIAGPGIPSKGEYVGASLLDVAPTVLDVMDQGIPAEMEGVSISGKERSAEEEEALVQERLKFLGY